MRSKEISIELDNPIAAFIPGQTITGRVILNNEKSKEFKYFCIKFEGCANVEWTERHGTGQHARTSRYTAKEEYFSSKIILLGSESESLTLLPGYYSYPFNFTLPLNLPTSFISEIGTIDYKMEARMKRAWHKLDYTSTVPFTITGSLDLNLEPLTAQPVFYTKEKYVCCLWCKSGPLSYKITLGKTGFVPGELTRFSGEFVNHSRRRVKAVKLSLEQRVTFHAEGRSKEEIHQLCSEKNNPIEPGEEYNWSGDILQIPHVPPTRLAGCRIIDMQYFLKLEMVLSGLATKLKADIPITIGTIPFRKIGEGMSMSTAPIVPGFGDLPGYNVSGAIADSGGHGYSPGFM